MQVYDIIMIVVLVGATLFGAYKGLAWQIASLGAIIASYFVAMNFRGPVSQLIDATPPWNMFLAMLILYVGTSFLIWVGFRYISNVLDRLKLKEFDRQLGGLLGFAKGVLFCVIITLFAMTLLGDAHRRAIVRSRSGYYIAVVLDKSHRVMPAELHDVLHPYVHVLDENVDHAGHDHDSADRAHVGDDLHAGHQDDGHQDNGEEPPVARIGLGGVELIPADDLLDLLERRASDAIERQFGDDGVRR